jgi:hypothetical protein
MLNLRIMLILAIGYTQQHDNTTTTEGAAIKPIRAANAPFGPRNFMPKATDKLMMLPPSKN